MEYVVCGTPSARAAEALRPARLLRQRRLALGRGTELFEQLTQRHPLLKLNTIHSHLGLLIGKTQTQCAPAGDSKRESVRPS